MDARPSRQSRRWGHWPNPPELYIARQLLRRQTSLDGRPRRQDENLRPGHCYLAGRRRRYRMPLFTAFIPSFLPSFLPPFAYSLSFLTSSLPFFFLSVLPSSLSFSSFLPIHSCLCVFVIGLMFLSEKDLYKMTIFKKFLNPLYN